MIFAYPLAFLFVPACFLLFALRTRQTSAVLYSHVALLEGVPVSWRIRLRTPCLWTLSLLTLGLLTVAAARPQRVTTIAMPRQARNVMLSIDVSNSMREPDFETRFGYMRRMEGVKEVVARFVEARHDERIGLVIFGHTGYLQSPLTMDHGLIAELVSSLEPGIAGDGTAIGDGLGLSIKRVSEIEGSAKTVILLTDGDNNSGELDPLQTAKIAKDLGIKVHTIGIGMENNRRTRRVPFSFTGSAEYDEKTLKAIAETTGGVFFNAGSIDKLSEVYAEIDKLEQTDQDEPERQIVDELFVNYALGAFVAYLLYLLLSKTTFLKLP